MNISFDNRSLESMITEEAILSQISDAGTDVSLSLDDNNGFANNDFVLIGNLENPQTELPKINAAVSSGTAIQVDTLLFPHNPMDPVSLMPYNKIRLYNASTPTGLTSLVEEKYLDVDQRYTDFVVSDSSTGYFFFAPYNSYAETQGEMSGAISATEHDSKSRMKIRSFIEVFYKEDLDDDELQILMDTALDEIFALRHWTWREGKFSFTTTADVTDYDIAEDIGVSDYGTLLSARTATKTLEIAQSMEDDILSMNTVVLVPYSIMEWAGILRVRTGGAVETVTIKYYKDPTYLIANATDTIVKLPAAIGFLVLYYIYKTRDEKLSMGFYQDYLRTIRVMKNDDEKYASKVGSLNEAAPNGYRSPIPNIISD